MALRVEIGERDLRRAERAAQFVGFPLRRREIVDAGRRRLLERDDLGQQPPDGIFRSAAASSAARSLISSRTSFDGVLSAQRPGIGDRLGFAERREQASARFGEAPRASGDRRRPGHAPRAGGNPTAAKIACSIEFRTRCRGVQGRRIWPGAPGQAKGAVEPNRAPARTGSRSRAV